MKNKKNIILISGIILVVILIAGFIFFLGGEEYKMQMPKDAENYLSISLIKKDEKRLIENQENIQKLLDVLFKKERKTREESIQDIPLDVEGKIQMEFTFDKNSTSTTTVYAYKKKGKYYLEQPYNGAYKISEEEYNNINKFYNNLKEEINDTEKKSLTKRVDDLEAVDQLGKSFKSSDLTNEEMLRIGYSIFGPTKDFGFTSITFDSLNRTYIKGFLGREDAVAKDITCSCGEVIASYNRSDDKYTWDDKFHYLAHKSSVYNEIVDMYKVEDKYIVKVYKIFSDTMENSSLTNFNFYPSYNDAVNKKNVLFTVTSESEFNNALESLDNSKKTLYTLTFEKDGSFKLVDYEIGKTNNGADL